MILFQSWINTLLYPFSNTFSKLDKALWLPASFLRHRGLDFNTFCKPFDYCPLLFPFQTTANISTSIEMTTYSAEAKETVQDWMCILKLKFQKMSAPCACSSAAHRITNFIRYKCWFFFVHSIMLLDAVSKTSCK